MSTYFTVVLVPSDASDIEACVAKTLERYGPNGDHPKWDFYQIGGRANRAVKGESYNPLVGFDWWNHKSLDENMVPVMELPEGLNCHAVVTLDGTWHDTDSGPDGTPGSQEWLPRMWRLMADHREHIAVGCQVHC